MGRWEKWMRPVRVLYYIAYPQRMAGSNRSLYELIVNLPDSIQPIVVFAAPGRAVEAYQAAGIEVHVISPGSKLTLYEGHPLRGSWVPQLWIAWQEYLPYTIKLHKFIQAFQIDLVHANEPRATILSGLAARWAGCPLVAHIRGQSRFRWLSRLLVHNLPHRLIFVSDALR